MRGSTPLDVAASSVMDNNSLALALEEPDLEKVGDTLSVTLPHYIIHIPHTHLPHYIIHIPHPHLSII
jgi:hypothetical protein